MLRDSNRNTVIQSGRVSHQLQTRSLGVLAPGQIDAKSDRLKRQSHQNDKTEGTKAAISQETEAIGKSQPFPLPTSGMPVRRIRRPTAIRRPKLIGKSVEGAALQAVAASRKRASSNQFRNKTGAPQAARSGGKGASSRDLSKTRGTAGKMLTISDRQTSRSTAKETEEDVTLTRVQRDYLNLLAEKRRQTHLLSSLQQSARFRLVSLWWPRVSSQRIPESVANFLTSIAPRGWNDTCALPLLPEGISQVFMPTLARWIVAISPGLELLPTRSSTKTANDILLCSAIRNIHGSKCCVIARISFLGSSTAVKTEGWVINLPRRPAASQRRKADTNFRSSLLIEKDAVGMDLLLKEVHVSFVAVLSSAFSVGTRTLTFVRLQRSLGLERLLFDFTASMIERAVRLLDERIQFEDLIATLRALMRRYPYERQKRYASLFAEQES